MIHEIQAGEQDEFLDDLVTLDEDAQVVMQALARGQEIPATSLSSDFEKVVRILEEGVRGFTIGRLPHPTNFWAGKTRDQFIAADARPMVVARNPDNTINTDPATAPLIRRLEDPDDQSRMPRLRPAIPASRIGFIRQWITDGCPDSSAPGEIGLEHEQDPRPEPLPGPAPGPLSFQTDIKDLFRETPDRTHGKANGSHVVDHLRQRGAVYHTRRAAPRVARGQIPCIRGRLDALLWVQETAGRQDQHGLAAY